MNLYKEAFPENPAFAAQGAKKKAAKAEVAEPAPVEEKPQVDVNKVVEDALSFVADTVIFGTLNSSQTKLSGTNQHISDSLAHITNAWSLLTAGTGTWSQAKGQFVDIFSRLL